MRSNNNNQNNIKTRNLHNFKLTRSDLCKKNFSSNKSNRNESASIEIPFNFNKLSSNIFNNTSQSGQTNNQMFAYIKMNNFPILNIDISNDYLENQLINQYKVLFINITNITFNLD